MKINVVTLCSGYDSQCMALDRLKAMHPDFNYELVAWCEIDKYAIQSHNAIYPQWADRNLGDMTKVDWKNDVHDVVDLLTYSTPCITEESLILTKKGYKKMKDVCVGDEVLTKSNTWHKVAKKFDNGVHKTYLLNGLGFENIHCTGNHKFYVRTMSRVWDSSSRRYKRVFSEPCFKQAMDITKKDYFGIPVSTESKLPSWNGVIDNRFGHGSIKNEISEKMKIRSFWYMLGRYLGDGWTRDNDSNKGIVICCGGRNEDKLAESITESGYNYSLVKEDTVNKYFIYSSELNAFVERYGHHAHGKHIDGETMMLPVELLESFVNGCMDSDGCFTQNHYKYSSISRELIYGMSFCINKVYHRYCCIHKTNRPSTCVIEGRTCNQRDSYELTFTKDIRKQDQAFYEDGYIWFPFRSLELVGDEHVYNMEVEEDHSYIVQGCISKNCQDISNAGLQRGLGDGTRSGILWDTAKAIKELRPRYLMQENVKALVGKKFMPEFQKWLKILEELGYTNFWKVVNATECNIPQNRERVFCISIRNDGVDPKYDFPEPLPLTKTIEDVLEDDVDESYFLKDEQVNKFLDMIKEEKDGL